jgi:hypothetical protein
MTKAPETGPFSCLWGQFVGPIVDLPAVAGAMPQLSRSLAAMACISSVTSPAANAQRSTTAPSGDLQKLCGMKQQRWQIVGGPVPQPRLADSERYLHIVERGPVRASVEFEFSGTVMACAPELLASPIGDAVRTRGAAIIEAHATDAQLPARIKIGTSGIRFLA